MDVGCNSRLGGLTHGRHISGLPVGFWRRYALFTCGPSLKIMAIRSTPPRGPRCSRSKAMSVMAMLSAASIGFESAAHLYPVMKMTDRMKGLGIVRGRYIVGFQPILVDAMKVKYNGTLVKPIQVTHNKWRHHWYFYQTRDRHCAVREYPIPAIPAVIEIEGTKKGQYVDTVYQNLTEKDLSAAVIFKEQFVRPARKDERATLLGQTKGFNKDLPELASSEVPVPIPRAPNRGKKTVCRVDPNKKTRRIKPRKPVRTSSGKIRTVELPGRSPFR